LNKIDDNSGPKYADSLDAFRERRRKQKLAEAHPEDAVIGGLDGEALDAAMISLGYNDDLKLSSKLAKIQSSADAKILRSRR